MRLSLSCVASTSVFSPLCNCLRRGLRDGGTLEPSLYSELCSVPWGMRWRDSLAACARSVSRSVSPALVAAHSILLRRLPSRVPMETRRGVLLAHTILRVISELLTAMRWRSALWIAAGLGFVVALSLQWLMPPIPTVPSVPAPISLPNHMVAREGGFWLLFVIGALDTATRIGFLLFLPFLLKEKGAGPPLIGLALSFVFIGGGFGKAACGWLGERFGLLATVVTTEVGTAATIFGLLHLQLRPSLALLPLLGIMLNGTSSVLYGTVPELVERSRLERAFAIFYTGVLGASALAPILYGRFGDIAGISWGTIAAALTALAVVPLMLILTPKLKKQLQVPE